MNKGLKEFLKPAQVHAAAAVANPDLQFVFIEPNIDCDFTFIGKLDGIVNQLGQRSLEKVFFYRQMNAFISIQSIFKTQSFGLRQIIKGCTNLITKKVELDVTCLALSVAILQLRYIQNSRE